MFVPLPPPPPAIVAQPLATAEQMLPFARSVWPGSPCEGREVVERVSLPHDFGQANIDGSCRVEIDSHLRGEQLCITLTHELGHLAGHGHAGLGSYDVMNPYLQWWEPCFRRFGSPMVSAEVSTKDKVCSWTGTTRARTTRWECQEGHGYVFKVNVTARGEVLWPSMDSSRARWSGLRAVRRPR